MQEKEKGKEATIFPHGIGLFPQTPNPCWSTKKSPRLGFAPFH